LDNFDAFTTFLGLEKVVVAHIVNGGTENSQILLKISSFVFQNQQKSYEFRKTVE